MIPSPPYLLLWFTLVMCVPLPFFLVEIGQQPLAGLLQIFGVTLTLIATEGSSGAVTIAAWMLGVQLLLGAALLTLATSVIMRMLRRGLGENATLGTYALVAVIVAVAVTQPIYRTPFRAAGLHATLGQVFE
ncbi:MAG TPA: hypothetical protein VN634_18180 [Candidatus Limnocylindrales bacterium]|nr:hypothetical protein [Candidatus Limnocylindrales bacterium]